MCSALRHTRAQGSGRAGAGANAARGDALDGIKPTRAPRTIPASGAATFRRLWTQPGRAVPTRVDSAQMDAVAAWAGMKALPLASVAEAVLVPCV